MIWRVSYNASGATIRAQKMGFPSRAFDPQCPAPASPGNTGSKWPKKRHGICGGLGEQIQGPHRKQKKNRQPIHLFGFSRQEASTGWWFQTRIIIPGGIGFFIQNKLNRQTDLLIFVPGISITFHKAAHHHPRCSRWSVSRTNPGKGSTD